MPPTGWPSSNYLAMIMAGDNHGPPSPAELADLRQHAEKDLPGVRIHFGTLDDFARAVLAENPDLPVVRGDTPDTWIHGLLSMPEATKIARDIHPMEPALDSLDTHLHIWGLTTSPLAGPLADAYENSMLYGEHTFGMNGAFGGRQIWGLDRWKKQVPPRSTAKFLLSFEDKRDYIRKTQSIVDGGLRARLGLLAGSISVDGRIVVWNALPWARTGVAQLSDPARAPAALKDLITGKIVPVQDGAFLASDIPPNGYMTFVPGADAAAASDSDTSTTLTTPFYKVSFDLERAGIASLVELSSGP